MLYFYKLYCGVSMKRFQAKSSCFRGDDGAFFVLAPESMLTKKQYSREICKNNRNYDNKVLKTMNNLSSGMV